MSSIVRLKYRLSDIIDPDFGLLDKLLRLKVLNRREVADVRSERTVYRRNAGTADVRRAVRQVPESLTANPSTTCFQLHRTKWRSELRNTYIT